MPDRGPSASQPFILEHSPTLCFVDRDDVPWNVFDCRSAAGRLVIVTPGSPGATFRVFERADGSRRIHRFVGDESRAIDPAVLDQQCAVAPALGTLNQNR
jgi:hypothetical protein